MTYQVIFDTNAITNTGSLDHFFGGREQLFRFAKDSEIIFPDTVIEEIKNHKRKHLMDSRKEFIKNPFCTLMNVDLVDVKTFDVERFILDLLERETIPYTVISLSNPSALKEIWHLSLQNLPPFDKHGDKGFKDAYIYLTVLEYVETALDVITFFVTQDARLTEAFQKHRGIVVVSDYGKFKNYKINYFAETHFLEQLNAKIEQETGSLITINSDDLEELYVNIEGNWAVKIVNNGNIFHAEVNLKEKKILNVTDVDFSELVDLLINSSTFQETHEYIGKLQKYKNYLTNTQIENLIEAATINNQIYFIHSDEDVRTFFTDIYRKKLPLLDWSLQVEFEFRFKP